jgi:hypothetical protein
MKYTLSPIRAAVVVTILMNGSISLGADKGTMFSVSVLTAVEPTFVARLESRPAYSNARCVKNPAGQIAGVNADYPVPSTTPGYNLYTRIFYECPKPSKALFAAFGDASFEAARVSATTGDREPVRVVADTIVLPRPGGACTALLCLNGTYRKALDRTTCASC